MRISQTFLLIFLLFLSCSSSEKLRKNEPYRLVINTYWVLYSIQQEPVSYGGEIPPYIFFEPSGQYSGFTGCNHFFGQYRLTSKKLILDYEGATKKLCFEQQEMESAFLRMLRMEMKSYKVEKKTLRILGEKGELLHFVAVDSIPALIK